MARITEAELERLKSELSLVRIIEDSGIDLKKRGKDHVGCCPFHDDKTPSLVVTPAKNLFHCFGCGAAGGVIDWVMKMKGVSFRHAVELLKSDPSLVAGEAKPIKQSTVPVLPAPVALETDEQTALDQVIAYYHETLKTSPNALEYLASRGLSHPDLIDTFKLGYSNRTLGLRLPDKNRKAGAEIRSRLERAGIYRNSGHEHFSGSLVVPVIDRTGRVREVYGRKTINHLRPGTPMHLYLPGQHAGIWNESALEACAGEVILCESLIDAMTFWVNGFRNVTASYGVNGFTDEMLEAFKSYGVKRVLVAYDRDEAGDKAAHELAEKLCGEGIGCFRIQFPKGMDANEYALKMTPPQNALSLLIRKAEWIGNGKAPVRNDSENPFIESVEVSSLAAESLEETAAAKEEAAIPEPTRVSPLPEMPQTEEPAEQTEHDLVLAYGDRRYRIRGWKRPLNPESLKVNLLVSRGEHFHIDTFDLYHAKARAAFMKQAAMELGEAEDVVKHDLGKVLLKLEELQSAQLETALAKEDKVPKLSEADYNEAMAFLKSPDLMDQLLADFEACGVMGEETNKLVGYLAAVSRQLDKPLAVIIQSSSAAGKSSLMDAVLALMPEEAQVRYSAMTGQSLFYMGDTNLKHKILAIAEEEGVSQAGYALKLLQSDGQVTIASTGKDPSTGRLVTQEYRVEGPVMLFLTTTAIDIDEELLNRCLVLTVNESREQTRAIHALQRKWQTLEGLLADEDRENIQTLHRNVQRLLQPLKVVNPYADKLTFLDDKTRTRRDHMKYLTLIRTITLLYQYQRPIKAVQHRGKNVQYIEVELQDIALANRLAHDVLGRTLDELPPQTRKLLQTLSPWVKEECKRLAIKRSDYRFTRRQIRQLTGWGDTQLRLHLERLVQMEYLIEYGGRRGNLVEYEIIYDGEGDHGNSFLMGLLDIDSLKDAAMNKSSRGEPSQFAGSSRPQSGSKAGSSRGDEIALQALPIKASTEMISEDVQKALLAYQNKEHHTVVIAEPLSC
jgi:DNA primase